MFMCFHAALTASENPSGMLYDKLITRVITVKYMEIKIITSDISN